MFYIRFVIKKILEKLSNRSFLLISSFLVSNVSESLISLKSNERCEQIAQVAHQKWATMSNLPRSLRRNEQMSESLILLSELLICSFLNKKRAIRLEIKWTIYQPWGIVKSCFTQMLLNIQICILPFLVARKQN